MSRTTGLAIGAAVVSITLGVLIGVVIHAGQLVRSDQSAGPVVSATEPVDAVSSSTIAGTVVVVTDESSSTAIAQALSSAETPPPTSSAATPVAPVPSTSPVLTSPTSRAGIAGATPTTTGSSSAVPTAVTGEDAEGGACPTLAAKSVDAQGVTLFCQVDQKDRVLKWRAVTLGGGCLSQTMVGVAADGSTYACRLDSSGRNHWAPIG